MWTTAQLRVKPSPTWMTISLAVPVMALLGLWLYPPWPSGGYWVLACTSAIVLALLVRSWRQWVAFQGLLELQPNGRLRLRLEDTYQAQLHGSAGVGGWCCRFSLRSVSKQHQLPPAWRHVVLFRDSLSEADYRALCRWLAQHPK